MTVTYTKAQATRLLNVAEMKLFEESRINMLRKFSASQLDRRVLRTRELRDKARDLLQRQRVAMQQKTGSKRGLSGTADQRRSKDKAALIADILKRFEGQLKVARRNEKAGKVPTDAPRRRVTRKAVIAKAKAPHGDFTASRMRARNAIEDEAGRTMKARKTAAKKTTRPATAKKATTKKTPTKPASKAAKRPAQASPAGETRGKRTANLRALDAGHGSSVHAGFVDARSRNIAQQRKFQDALTTPIHAHISSRGRRDQAKRDNRD